MKRKNSNNMNTFGKQHNTQNKFKVDFIFEDLMTGLTECK